MRHFTASFLGTRAWQKRPQHIVKKEGFRNKFRTPDTPGEASLSRGIFLTLSRMTRYEIPMVYVTEMVHLVSGTDHVNSSRNRSSEVRKVYLATKFRIRGGKVDALKSCRNKPKEPWGRLLQDLLLH